MSDIIHAEWCIRAYTYIEVLSNHVPVVEYFLDAQDHRLLREDSNNIILSMSKFLAFAPKNETRLSYEPSFTRTVA